MRLSHLAAMATLVALLGAMFVAMGSAGAQTADPPMCGASMTLMLEHDTNGDDTIQDTEPQNETCTVAKTSSAINAAEDVDITLESGTAGVATFVSSAPANNTATVTFTAAMKGTATFKVAIVRAGVLSNVSTHKITVTEYTADEAPDTSAISPDFKITFIGDSDNIVAAGTSVDLKVEETNATLTRITVSGGLSFFQRIEEYRYLADNTNKPDDDDDQLDLSMTASQWRNVIGTIVPTHQVHLATSPGAGTIYETAGETRFSQPKRAEDDGTIMAAVGDTLREATLELHVPVGTTPGEYTVTAIGTYNRDGRDHVLVKPAILTVGDTSEVESVSFGLSSPRRINLTSYVPGAAPAVINAKAMDKVGGGAKGDMPDGYDDDVSTKERSSISVGSANTTELTLSILNLSGKPSEADAITSIVISTTGGSLSANAGSTETYRCDSVQRTRACEIDISSYADAGDPLPAKIRLLLNAPETPGTAEVTAVVVAGGEVFTPDAVTVTFYGPLDELDLGDASATVLGYDVVGGDKDAGMDGESAEDKGDADKGSDKRDQITFSVGAMDANGNTIRTPDLTVKISDPDGVTVSPSKYEKAQTGALNNTLHIDVDTAATAALAAGTYTLEVSKGAKKASVEFDVVHTADGIEAEASEMNPSEIGDTVTVSVEVSSDGTAVADGTPVTFRASDKAGDTDSILIATTTETPMTKGGMAQVTYVTVGNGAAVVTATVADDTTPVNAVLVIQSTAGAPEPVVEPEPEPEVASVDCLSNLSGFSTWTCGVDADVSEIFTMVSERGVTAIHLWNGTNWVRYSVVGGSEVPGSSDFMVTKTDILYISQ